MDLKAFLRSQWDRVGAWAAFAVGVILLILGWLGVSNSVYPAEQLPYIISGGLAGVALIGVGATLWLSADIRDEWTELHEIARLLGREEAKAAQEGPAATIPPETFVPNGSEEKPGNGSSPARKGRPRTTSRRGG
jgi:hypothetical protein